MIPVLLVALLVVLPLTAGVVSMRLALRDPTLTVRISAVAAVLLALLASVAAVGARLPLPANRALALSSVAQFGVELLALGMLGLLLALHHESDDLLARWLPVAWLSLAGLVTALLLTSLPVAVLVFLAATMLWVFSLAPSDRAMASAGMQRYLAFAALALPLLLAGFQIAEARTASAPALEMLTLALLVPGFGLLLGLVPLHGLAMTLASGAPRSMLFGVLILVQTAGFLLLLRALEVHPWLAAGAQEALVLGGALSVLVGGWLAVSARRDDPDDWLVYATVASSGLLLVGLGTQTRTAAVGVLLLLLARVLALVLLALAPRIGRWRLVVVANSVAVLTLAGTPGLAGFPGLWLVLQPLLGAAAAVIQLAVLLGSALLFATALRRWGWGGGAAAAGAVGREEASRGAERITMVLVAVLVALGIAPGVILPALADVLRDMSLVR